MKKNYLLFLIMLLAVNIFAQQNGTIKGVVKDQNGASLPGANLIVLESQYGAAANFNGEYTITLPPGRYSVRATYIGYEAITIEEINVTEGSVTTVDFTLPLSVIYGQEVVVIGYGVQQKRDLTGSATTVRMDDVMKISTTQASVAIQGRAPGVNVSQTGGDPGSSADIKIRGAGTLGGTFPLVIVDGVPSSLSAVNPQDIASIDILKDAAAAAIYGSRAGNGVLIITTKRGAAGPVKISFNSRLSQQSLTRKFDLVTNPDEYISIVKSAAENGGVPYPQFVEMYAQNPGQFSSGTDWQDAYFRTALMQHHDLSISGGSENAAFSVSAYSSNQKGIVVTTHDERMGLRINSDFTKGRLKIGESFSINRNIGKGRYDSLYSFFYLSGLSPLTPVYDSANPTGWAGQNPAIGFYREAENVVANMHLRDNKYDNMNMLASAYLEYNPFSGITYTARLSQNISNNHSYNFAPAFFLGPLDNNEVSWLSESRSRRYHTIMDHVLNYQISLKKHDITLMAGYSQESSSFRSAGASVTNFPDNKLRVLDAGTESDNAFGYEVDWRYQSYFGRVNYNFADKYLFQATIRRDGSSRFSPENRWGDFPSISAAWRISEEKFFRLPLVNDFKIRASYGKLGMQEFADYLYYYLIASDHNRALNYPFGQGKDQPIYIGSRATSFPSIDLKWESSQQTNIGFDMALLDNKLTLEFDYYIKNNTDILYNPPIPMSAGSLVSPTVNVADIENKGIELAMNYRNMEHAVKYEINFTAATYNNQVKRLGYLGTEVIWGGNVYWAFDNTTKSEVGRPIAPFYLLPTDGIFKSQAEVDAYLAAGGAYLPGLTPQPGDVKYVDANGDGVINTDDKTFFGTAQPSAEFGLNLNLSYRNFDFNCFLYAVTGKQMINGARWLSMWTNRPPANYHKDMTKAWSPDNPNSDIPRVIQNDNRNTLASDLWLEDADYLRLRHIELGYTLPVHFVYKFGIESLRFFIAGSNLFTLTKYSGYDPAIDYGTLFSRGVDRSPYPTAREFITGVQISL